MTKWVYTFGDGKAEGNAGMRNLLGGKGANLAEMSSIGCPVPPGFTITTEAYDAFTYETDSSTVDFLTACAFISFALDSAKIRETESVRNAVKTKNLLFMNSVFYTIHFIGGF